MNPIISHENLNEDELSRLAHILTPLLQAGDYIGLSGNLGAGKSVFARALIRTAMGDEKLDVPSPTFTLVHPYAPPQPTPQIIHIDLYRVENETEMRELDFDEAKDAIVLIEWPERLAQTFPKTGLVIKIAHSKKDGLRNVTFWGNKGWARRLKNQVLIRQ